MAQYIGFLTGGRGETSRLGTKKTGMSSEVRGWNSGGYTHMSYDKDTNQDEVSFHTKEGSAGGTTHLLDSVKVRCSPTYTRILVNGKCIYENGKED